jgi:hypothetical protein
MSGYEQGSAGPENMMLEMETVSGRTPQTYVTSDVGDCSDIIHPIGVSGDNVQKDTSGAPEWSSGEVDAASGYLTAGSMEICVAPIDGAPPVWYSPWGAFSWNTSKTGPDQEWGINEGLSTGYNRPCPWVFEDGVKYYLRVRFYSPNGCSKWVDGDQDEVNGLNGNQVPQGGAVYCSKLCYTGHGPSAPADVVATADPTSGTQAALTWTNDGAADYVIEQNGVVINAGYQLSSDGLTYKCTISSGLSADTPYVFGVAEAAADDGGIFVGPFKTSTVTTTPFPATPVAVSTAISPGYFYFGNGVNQLELMWRDMADDETGFEVERSTHSNFANLDFDIDTSDASEYFDDTVTPSDTYYYRVRAINGALQSGWLNILGPLNHGITIPTT